MKRISQCRSRSSKGLRDRKCPEAEGWNKKNIRPNGFQVKSDAEMTAASWVSSGSRRPPLLSSRTPSTELEQQFGEWRRREVMALRPLENNLLSQSTRLQASPPAARDLSSGWLEGHGNDSGSCLCPAFVLQTESVTWRWTPTPWPCPCRTRTPGRQPWTTLGCPPSESADNSWCQVRRYWDFWC